MIESLAGRKFSWYDTKMTFPIAFQLCWCYHLRERHRRQRSWDKNLQQVVVSITLRWCDATRNSVKGGVTSRRIARVARARFFAEALFFSSCAPEATPSVLAKLVSEAVEQSCWATLFSEAEAKGHRRWSDTLDATRGAALLVFNSYDIWYLSISNIF
jgi:hypothetical protein